MAGAPFWGLNDAGVISNEAPTFMDDPWDTFWINELQMPGKCTIQGSPGGLEVEKYKGKNRTGGSIKIFGYLPGEFDLVVEITTPDQWDEFQNLQDAFWPGPIKGPRVDSRGAVVSPGSAGFNKATQIAPFLQGLTVHVRHPDLQRLRVDKAVLVNLPLSEPSQTDGARNFRWKFYQQVTSMPAQTVVASTGALPPPEYPGLPPSNATPDLPSGNPANASLEGPPLSTQGGAQ